MTPGPAPTAPVCPACALPADTAEPRCPAGWKSLPEDLRRLLATTYQAMRDSEPDAGHQHAQANRLAADHRIRSMQRRVAS